MNFDEIRKLKRRCDHFVGECSGLGGPSAGWLSREEWKYVAYTGPVEGMGIAARNYSDMLSLDYTYTEWLLWLNDLAAAFNHYIDRNRIAEDNTSMQCLRWWRNFLFFDVEALA